jgi:Ca2+-binding EF-hand superfamily protein
MKYLFQLYDIDGDGVITSIDFDILANKLSALVGQEDPKRREDYAVARKILCEEIMRADANHDGKVTLGKQSSILFFVSLENQSIVVFFFCRRMARFPSTSGQRITKT